MSTTENEEPTLPVEGSAQGTEATLPASNGEPATAVPDAEAQPPAEPETPPQPEPEPWTPERVLEWNRYYDLYVCAAVLLLVFIASAHKILSSSVWTHIQTGRLIAANGPIKADPFSYTETGRPWVDTSWLYSLGISQVYDLPRQFVGTGRADEIGAIALVALNALVRALTALVLLGLRRRGPGLWWVALCVAIALGGMWNPPPGPTAFIPSLGGVARPAEVDPFTWGLLFLAIELLAIHGALNLGRFGLFYGLVPLFVLWANIDESFVYGLIILALAVVGSLIERRNALKVPVEEARPALKPARGFGVLAACVAVCLINPSIASTYAAALQPYIGLFQKATGPLTQDQISIFGPAGRAHFNRIHGDVPNAATYYMAYFVLLVGAGLISFALNWRRFHWGRFLIFAFASVMWGALWHTTGEFSVILAAILAWNGQEWYLDAYGSEGRLGAGWSVWSVGGRMVTLLVLFALIGKGLTGYLASSVEPVFGFGYNPSDFSFEAAEFLRDARITGNVLNTTNSTGDALIWRAWRDNHDRKTFIDSRAHLFPPSLRQELDVVRKALRDKEPSIWRPILDKYKIQIAMITATERRTAQGLAESPDWIPFYDDGNVLMFGRADAKGEELAFFKENRLDAEQRAFHRDAPVPMPDRAPNPVSYIDKFFPNRSLVSTEPHVAAAEHWLKYWGIDQTAQKLPDIPHCLVAIREARIATAHNPDDPMAWRRLDEAYMALMADEAQILAKTVSTPPVNYRMYRFRQRAAVLNYAIQTTPPPRSVGARVDLAQLNVAMADLFREANFFDLEREKLRIARDLFPASEVPEPLDARLSQLDEALDKLENQMEELKDNDKTTEVDRAEFALSQGAPGMAIKELEEANESGVPRAQVKPKLLDLYCQIGEPDKALELFNMIDDPNLMTGAGTSAYRQGMANLLLGGYDVAAQLWETRALPQLRSAQSFEALEAARNFLQGEPRGASQAFQDLPNKVGIQATWEFELGLALIEGGRPSQAAEHLQTALKLEPEMNVRGLLEYYLEQLGQPVPPKGEGDAKEKEKAEAEEKAPANEPRKEDKR